ncbi:MAG: hypothetical protein UT24_C0011G0002 [Candidatus Woesebacteria bacterium GW2011_GWB1_39_12]|uniref:Uncharacterized protein n=1 Tax=Candidatus Woesebacteria bacterium GW2011_GWB1_39_12 TaxID=1618574 RepID=A0A0G0M8T7_9BACT|nr:MAG: hypothetical protein UT24_C0011G0002 [Candidatus Woesebacteria bacterium GW2011_GWB1_39_12]
MSEGFVGRKLIEIRAMTQEELDSECWRYNPGNPALVLIFEGNAKLFASRDAEGNDAGCLFGDLDGSSVFVMPEKSIEGQDLPGWDGNVIPPDPKPKKNTDFRVGDKVVITSAVSPKYLAGVEGEIVGMATKKVKLKLSNVSKSGGRFFTGQVIHCPVGLLERV